MINPSIIIYAWNTFTEINNIGIYFLTQNWLFERIKLPKLWNNKQNDFWVSFFKKD